MISLEALKLSSDVSPVPILLASNDGGIVYANAEFEALFEYQEGELVGTLVDVLVPPAFRDRHAGFVSDFFQHPAKRGMGRGRVLPGVTKYGEEIPLELGLSSVEADGGRYSVIVAVDMRKQLSQKRKLDLAMEAAATAMIMVDDQGRIVLSNAAVERLTGYARTEIIGKPIEILISEPVRVAHRVYRAHYTTDPEERQMSREIDISIRAKDGSEVPVEIALTPVSTPEGNMVMSTIVDLRERLSAERAMQQKNDELDSANTQLTGMIDELSQFAYSISHDLKAPLASLQGLLTIAAEDVAEGNVEDAAGHLSRAIGICRRNSSKVERILTFARRIDEEDKTSVDLTELLNNVWDSIAPGAEVPAHLDLDLEIESVTTAATSLDVILQNLISNAVKYHDPAKGAVKVRVTSRQHADRVRIAVEDDGAGIADTHTSQVFEMFRKFDQRGGDGIGLALVQKHVSRIGGKISLASTPKKGTVVTVELPLT